MLKNRHIIAVLLLLWCFQMQAQTIEISGVVKSKTNVESIHVINKTAQKFTTTNVRGEFKITASLQDTLQFTSVQHKPKEVVVSETIISLKTLTVTLEEQINELDEVVVGKVLTGDLSSDINNVEGDPPINFYDVGIPGYKGKPATQSERRLAEAGEFKPKMLLGALTGSIPLNPILNGISGRTKMLKNRIEVEERETLMRSIKARLFEDFFAENPLDENLRMDFFYFCAEDENFLLRCKDKSDLEVVLYLEEKYKQYQVNLSENKD